MAVARFAYRRPNQTAPAPPALSIGLDWREFHTPPCAGGMRDQPVKLLNEIRLALSTYDAINAWRQAQNQLNADGFQSFCSSNPRLVDFMQRLWALQDELDV